MNRLAAESHIINSVELNKIDNSHAITKLYRSILGDGDIRKVKHQRNLQVLDQFTTITREAANQTISVLEHLGRFQTEVDQMKKTVSIMNYPRKSHVDIYLDDLSDAIEKLRTYHLRFVQRRNAVNQI